MCKEAMCVTDTADHQAMNIRGNPGVSSNQRRCKEKLTDYMATFKTMVS
jgi:hypothetical protein